MDEATQTATLKLWAGACECITQNGQTTILNYLSSPAGLYGLHRASCRTEAARSTTSTPTINYLPDVILF